jgi:hypothetical protein
VSAIDAKVGLSGNQAFALDTNSSFSRGEIRQKIVDSGLLIEFNIDSSSDVDMAILVEDRFNGLSSSDFILGSGCGTFRGARTIGPGALLFSRRDGPARPGSGGEPQSLRRA